MNEDPIYRLPDDEEDVDINNAETTAAATKTPSPMMAMLRVLIGPVDGWKAIKRAKFTTGRMAAGCFIPLLILCALSEVSGLFFEANLSIHDIIVECIITFISYFFGYYLSLLLPAFFFPKDCRNILKTEFFKVFVMTAMSTLVFFHIALNILPMFGPVLVFLPVWTIYAIARGTRLLRVPRERETAVAGLISLFVIGSPLGCGWLLNEILP